MAFIHTYLCWFIFITSSAAELKPPTNVNIAISGNNVTVTWTLPGESEIFTYLIFYSSQRREENIYITTPLSSYTITLTSCKKYRLEMQCTYPKRRRSKTLEKTFWVTNNIFYSNINTDINISWTTNRGQIYHVLSPSNRTIYTIILGDILPHTDMNKYKINSKGTEQIDISVLNVSQNDGGIYQSVDLSASPIGCCLLIITDKPTTPTIAVSKYPFVGDEIEFKCTSKVRRWPVDVSSSLTYTFSVDGEQQHNSLKINITFSDQGKQVYCNAMDDRGDVSNISNVIVLDPYFPPQTPTNFSLVSSTETSILVEWTPGYSDNHEQTFYLEYRARRTETWSLKEISHNAKQLTSLTYVLSGLQDSTLYELKMYSKKKFGRSLSTDIDIIQTREKQEKETSSSGLYAVIGGMAGVIAVLVIIVIILKRKKGCSIGARNNISNRSDNIDEMFSPNRTTNDMYEEIRKGTSGTRNEDLQQRGGNTSTTTCEMLAMQDIPNTYGDLSSEQEQRQSESTTEQYETLGEQDTPNVYEEIKNKEEPEDREYINLQL